LATRLARSRPAWLTASLVVSARTALELAELEVFDALTGRLVLTTTTEVAFGAPSVSVSGPRVYRLAKGTVLQLDRDEHGRWSEREVGQVVSGQTALYAAEVGGARRHAGPSGAARMPG
jgi:hypothetical protein